jgi:hypothetical protein
MSGARKVLAIVACAAGIAACKDVVPAVIVEPSEASQQALQQVINDAMGTDVMLAPSALTDSSVLYIERRMLESMDGLLLEGRRMDSPIRFKLVTDGSKCVLVDMRDESRHVLADTKCVAQ